MTVRPPPPAVDPAIVGDIKRASRATNVDFGYLMAQAAQESSFQPDAKASSSSATGLFQFIDSTWLQSVKQYGAKYGLGQYAAQIGSDENGRLHVADPAVKQQILDLRKDPKIASDIAAEFAKSNKEEVERALGRPANPTDLYLAHFLGAQGATQMVKTVASASTTSAAELLPQAAAANRSVFYDSNGDAKTVAQIYKSFADKIERQISQYSESTGTEPEEAAESLATKDETVLPEGEGQSLGTMNVLALAALKLISGTAGTDQPTEPTPTANRRRTTDTVA
jgi:Transglycosylase SLT domain